MKNIPVFFGLLMLVLGACNLTKDVAIELPEYDRQPVVECYLEPGKPFRLLLTQSYSFFDPLGLDSSFLEKTLLDGATVSITYNNKTVNLANQLSFELSPLKIFNYTATEVVPADPGFEYTLNITLSDGKTVTGKTVMLTRVPIDSVPIEFSLQKDSLARTLMYITDDLSTEDYYRRMLHYGSLDSLAQDFITSDRFSTTSKVAFGMGYDLVVGDTVFNTIFHITPDYYDYIESVQNAVAGSLNPFAQPSVIKSNVSGTALPLGIFTCLVYDRDTTVIVK
jgi:Domain of unknown function (DUF4249)